MMRHGHSALPVLTVNRTFIQDFRAAETPCFALGVVEAQHQHWGLLAFRPAEAIPGEITDKGLDFRHSVFGTAGCEVIHFAFAFSGSRTYHVLLNPNNPLVQTVMTHMIDRGACFFFALHPQKGVTTFRAALGASTVGSLMATRVRLEHAITSEAHYRQAVADFAAQQPPGTLLPWVCRDTVSYVDVTTDRLRMIPR